MTFLKRLRVLPVVLGVAATTLAIGSSLFGDVRPGSKPTDPNRPDGAGVVEDLALTKFSKLPALTYQPRDGAMLFAWQVKPQVEAAPARPRDVLVVVDNSASQAGKPLQQARDILTAYAATLGANDRVSVWLANTPASTRALTKGYFAPNSEQVREAAAALTDTEYGSGATDLKVALNKALKDLPPNDNRQQFVLFLGDGESAFNPLTEADRLALGSEMDRNNVFFFAVPLGLKVNPQNLHGLATITGGSVVRLQEDLTNPATRDQFIGRLTAAVATPVVKVKEFKFGEEVGEVYPSKLPPLRGDRTTLVMGKLAKPAAAGVSLAVKGAVAGRAVALNFAEKLPAPQREHFFLNMMLDQWQESPHKEAPAMLQSDRALALASTQVKLYKDEFLVQAVWAVRQSNFEDATNLYKAAQKIDPHDMEAAAGLVMIDRLKSGKITKADIERKINAEVDALKAAPNAAARTVIQEVVKQDPPVAAPAAQPANPPQAAADAIAEAAARRQVEEQRYRVLTDTTIRRARQLLRTDPDTAYADLKRQRDEIMGYGAIGNAARTQMVADLEAVMREIFLKGTEIKRQAAAEREAVAITRQRLNEFDRLQDDEARTKNRIDQFRQLMKQARFELAYQEAQLMIQERIVKGQSIPPATVASYIIGQHATQLREWRELVRIREDRYLLTMMQTEKSGIPYPDEPPVHFPPAAVWRELTSLRREAYINSNLGPNPTESAKQLKSLVEDQEVQLEDNLSINDVSLSELLSKLSKRYAVTFVIQTEKFVAEMYPGDIREAKATKLSATQLRGLKMGTFLDIVLMSMGATYIVRPDYIEITTFSSRLEEKVTRVFPVADLVIPIPSSVNQQTLQQNLQFQNAQLAIFGQVVGAANFQGFGGAFGQNQGQQFGQFQGQQFNANGNFNPLGNNVMGMGGGQQFMGQNQGFGGGFTGVGGGQLGQFGNLGGQFGIQGGDQSRLLLNLIVETVAKGEWAQAPNAAAQPGMDMDLPQLAFKQLNSLGYYPPARALVIRGTTRYHPAASVKLPIAAGGGQAVGPPNPRANGGGAVVIGPGSENNNNAVAAAGTKPTITDPKLDPVALEKKLSEDPRRRWSEAIAWTNIDPGLIVASAEFLMEMNEAASAAEVLKGALRKGLTTDDWVHDSLVVALQAAQGRADEVERAAVSGIDLEPGNAQAYLKAARAEADLKNHSQAVAFCKRAAAYAPDQPMAYANAMAYAESATEVKTDAVIWAANNLFQRDWNTNDGVNYHATAKQRLEKIVAKVVGAGQNADDLKKALTEQNQRDLVIELKYQGAADLDLVVAEPGGSICSATQKRTTGGGVLRGDLLEQGNDRAEIYTAATAFKGTYTVSVKEAFRKPIGGTAQLHVWKYKGTPKESYDLITIDMKNPKPIEIKLENGSRTDLATISEDADEFRAGTTGAALPGNATGLGGGFGTAGSLMTAPATGNSGSSLPIVNAATETRLPGIGAGAADLRASVKVNPDRQSYSVHVNPVFGTGKAVTMPKVALIPGGE
jgi:tetratricopeptide (TPR) repeat protein